MLSLRKPTIRNILKAIVPVYDSLDLLCPFVLKSKLIMQDVWRRDVNRKEEIRDKL